MPFKIIKYDHVDSTQNIAKEKNAPYLAIVAREMHDGRGRMHRKWFAKEGGLWLSVTYPINDSPHLFSLAAGVAVAKTFIKLGLSCCLKWPNDVMANNLKISGILCETQDQIAVIGIGVNLNNPLPEVLKEYATSAKSCGLNITVDDFLPELLQYLELELERKPADIVKEWKKYQCTLGRHVKVIDGKKEYHGTAIDIDKNGFLIIQTEMGYKTVIAGDLRFIQKEDEPPQNS
ncbi:MAG: biotin--[acetyl-CoA-carboxylase] ligase [Euryarchaeota archaeon]|nr:biotin--[acetyl-CoA-carboxylase] ligase [Euryarchaeota archaeon]